MKNRARFLEIENELYDQARSVFTVIPCPHEATTSYIRGTAGGPAAIINASQQIETFDIELGAEPYRLAPVYTAEAVSVKQLYAAVRKTLEAGNVPVVLGGEHSITPVAVKAFAERYPDLSVLQLDAHADLRDSYKGKKESHACTMRRVLEICPAVQMGIRSMSREEWDFAKEKGQLDKINLAGKPVPADTIARQLSDNVYVTIDVDVFDPSVIPATGTPEPGGLGWYELTGLIKAIAGLRNIVGFDVVELAPRRGDAVSDFTAARLVYKLMGYISFARRR